LLPNEIPSYTLKTTAAGTVKVTATITNGASATTNYTRDFDIVINSFVEVSGITVSPSPLIGTVGTFTFTATVKPDNATNKTVTWEVTNPGNTGANFPVGWGGGVSTGDNVNGWGGGVTTGSSTVTLTTTGTGTVKVKATIKNGKIGTNGAVTDFSDEFTITINAASGGSFTLTGIPEKYNGKYAYFLANNESRREQIVGLQSYSGSESSGTLALTLTRISNGSVNIPLWKVISDDEDFELERYSGNGTFDYIGVSIYDSQTIRLQDIEDGILSPIASWLSTSTVTFSNGSASMSWSQG
jgi:hypothetical protein